MRVPLSWLADHVDVDVPAATLAERLTFAGVEIETVDRVGEDLAGILTARVLQVTAHPDADRLVLVRIDAGGEDRSVVCGARNFAPGDVVPWAAPGAKLPGGVEVGRRQVRGQWSDGMLASARELGVFDDHSGILVLPPDTPVGADLVEAAASLFERLHEADRQALPKIAVAPIPAHGIGRAIKDRLKRAAVGPAVEFPGEVTDLMARGDVAEADIIVSGGRGIESIVTVEVLKGLKGSAAETMLGKISPW